MLASRVANYQPAMLDELMAAGEVLWSGAGSLPGNDGWISLHLAESAELTLNPPVRLSNPATRSSGCWTTCHGGGALLLPPADANAGGMDTVLGDQDVVTAALWELVWAGRITNDTFAPVRALMAGGHTAHRQRRPRAAARAPGWPAGPAHGTGLPGHPG